MRNGREGVIRRRRRGVFCWGSGGDGSPYQFDAQHGNAMNPSTVSRSSWVHPGVTAGSVTATMVVVGASVEGATVVVVDSEEVVTEEGGAEVAGTND